MYKILAKLPFRTNILHYLPSCHSTNEIAQQLLLTGSPEATVVITDDQIAGKGLGGNKWLSAPGQNLTFSIILKPDFLLPNEQFYITVAVSLGIVDALEDILPGEVKIKWPNDIYFNNKKMAGLLIENTIRGNTIESCIVGIGLNVNQIEFSGAFKATSIAIESGKKCDLNNVFNNVLSSVADYYVKQKDRDRKQLLNKYHNQLLGINELRKFKDAEGVFEGEITGTDEFGRLLISKNGNIQTYQRKEVEMLV